MGAGEQAWRHDDLAYDLGRWLKSGAEHWVWLNAALGEWSGPRPDVMAYRRHRYSQPLIRAYECKISRSDLLADLRAEKWRSYLEHCASVTFIMPSGLCKKNEIPVECGVMFRSGRGWRTERRPQDIGNSASVIAMAKLLTCHPLVIPSADTDRMKWRADGWRDKACRSFIRDIGKKHGRVVQSWMSALAEGRDPVAHAKAAAEKIRAAAIEEAEETAKLLEPVLVALGIDPTANSYQIASAIRERAKALDADGQLRSVRHQLSLARAALDRASAVALPVIDADAA